ncbi:hypothetical protein G7Y89_g10846 [Cudoniella acicularis]|uniref:tyrosinase n=1 Tax=Cudoniella acicularis TaxID=354080 RepID=A0A8H4RD19_9HELO|nr:hypothetical protein G7Y89_g10846 [Cudoniella acicularis]
MVYNGYDLTNESFAKNFDKINVTDHISDEVPDTMVLLYGSTKPRTGRKMSWPAKHIRGSPPPITSIMDALKKAQQDGVVIGLAKVANVAPRLDIDVLLLNEPDTFNLFLLALINIQKKDPKDIMGYYQIAGIHGLPKAFWDGVVVPNKEEDNRNMSGYCAHSVLTFPTWHRPYLAMMEQTIYYEMTLIAETFPIQQKQKYRDAAQKFRFPYWDYYRPRGDKGVTLPGVKTDIGTTSFKYDFRIPNILTTPKVMIRTTAKDALELLDNPLLLFDFPKSGSIPEAQWQAMSLDPTSFPRDQTKRYPRASDPINQLNVKLNSVREAHTGYILNMISDAVYAEYDTFATNRTGDGPSGSLEGIHGKYHGFIGGEGFGGHMSRVPVAAFDPVFWLHHCQIDRWLAVWQAINPQKWLAPGSEEEKSDLLPFRSQKGQGKSSYWNSVASRNWKDFGYTYPDVEDFKTPEQVKAAFREKYVWSRRTVNQPFGEPPANMKPLDLTHAQVFQFQSASIAPTFALHAQVAVHPPTAQKIFKSAAIQPAEVASTLISVPVAAGSATTEKSTDKTKNATPANDGKSSSQAAPQIASTNTNTEELQTSRELALNGAFTIFYFIGDFDKNKPGSYDRAPTLAGSSHVFAAPVELCDNCGQQELHGVLVSNTSPVNPILLDYIEIGELESLRPEHVKPFLVKNLEWRVLTVNGESKDPGTIRSLEVNVSAKVTRFSPAGTPNAPTYELYPEVIQAITSNAS